MSVTQPSRSGPPRCRTAARVLQHACSTTRTAFYNAMHCTTRRRVVKWVRFETGARVAQYACFTMGEAVVQHGGALYNVPPRCTIRRRCPFYNTASRCRTRSWECVFQNAPARCTTRVLYNATPPFYNTRVAERDDVLYNGGVLKRAHPILQWYHPLYNAPPHCTTGGPSPRRTN